MLVSNVTVAGIGTVVFTRDDDGDSDFDPEDVGDKLVTVPKIRIHNAAARSHIFIKDLRVFIFYGSNISCNSQYLTKKLGV
jgi:hypothetical protein